MAFLEIKNFQKSFGNKVVHKNVTFSVDKGECVGLIGGSGVGKSVILRSVIGLEKPDSGQIWIAGKEVSQLSESELIPIRKKVAYAFQGGALFDSMTVFQNLAYPLREHTKLNSQEIKQRIFAILNDFGLQGNEGVFPSQLSGGMQKRVGLARAMMLNPEVLLYDEPTAGLDPFNTKKIQELILKLKTKNVTSILVTHDMPTAFAVCDRLVYIQGGEVVFNGTLDEVDKDSHGTIAKFINGEAS
jgi:phospholipid/cholesterol/gamma-HCH transport system ATP-binding protein